MKDESPERTGIWGAEVAKAGFLRALLEHSDCDRVYLLCQTRRHLIEAADRLAEYPNRQRVEPILFADYPRRIAAQQRMVLFHPGSSGNDGVRNPAMQGLVNLRGFIGSARWPVTGVTHSLTGGPGFWLSFGALLESLRSYDSLVCTSEAGRDALRQMMSMMATAKARKYGTAESPSFQQPVIPLGTDTTTYRPRDKAEARSSLRLPQQPVIFLYLGRFSADYKADLFPLIVAFSRLPPAYRAKAKLLLAGDDVQHRLAPRLEAFAAAVGVSDHVSVLPNPTRENKRRLYNAADVFVSPSDSIQETFGQTVVEAMASGLPVIASDWNGYRDTIEDGVTGFLVPTFWADCFHHLRRTPFLWEPAELYRQLGQAVSLDMVALSGYMEQLICHDSLRKTMGNAARQRVLRVYDWPVIVRQYEALWAELMNQAAQCPGEREPADLTFDYLEVFRHHPTRLIAAQSHVQVSTAGAELAKDASRFQLFGLTELADVATGAQILAACAPHEKISVNDLIARLSQSESATADPTFQQIAQLIKYGFLELC